MSSTYKVKKINNGYLVEFYFDYAADDYVDDSYQQYAFKNFKETVSFLEDMMEA